VTREEASVPEREAEAFRHLPHPVAIWSADDRLVHYNLAFDERFGATRHGMLGMNSQAFLDQAQAVGGVVRVVFTGNRTTADSGLGAPMLDGAELVCFDGSVLNLATTPLPDGSVMATIVDVTSARRTAQALERARDAATLADQSKSRFLRAANHDLRQPLASLKILIYSCLAAETEEDRVQALHAMDVSVAIMEDLLGALLNIGQLDAGKIEPSITTFQISTVLARLKVQYEHMAREEGLRLTVVPSKLAVVSDRVLLERILSNFVANAIRYTAVGRVLIGCRRMERHLRIAVLDSGIGIAEEHHVSIFEEFFRISDTQAERKHSLGLGLNIAKRLSDMLDHAIGVKSIPGRGSMFYIDVPIGNVWHSTIGEPEISEKIGGEFSNLICLVLEDDKILLSALTSLLERWGITVLTLNSFENIPEAVRALEQQPDIIITDYRLRGRIQGTDVVNQVNDLIEKPCPALVVTAETGPDLIESIRSQGFPVLIKPVSPPSLRVIMHNLLFEPELVPEVS
jgi:signal transduction histidine kinase/CheY-like chemotaxis protein